MEDLYHELYLFLFNQITDAVGLIRAGNTEAAERRLVAAQQRAEEAYVTAGEAR